MLIFGKREKEKRREEMRWNSTKNNKILFRPLKRGGNTTSCCFYLAVWDTDVTMDL